VPAVIKVDSEFLKYCINEYERNIIKERINCKSNNEAAKHLGISRQTVDRVVNRVKNRMKTVDYLTVKGTSTLYDKDGNVKLQWVKTDIDKEIKLQAFLDLIKESLEEIKKEKKNEKIFREVPYILDEDILVVYPIGDLHLGMFSWDEETGENYDLKIAEKLLLKSFELMITSAPDSDTCILANLGDFFHIDDTRNETLRSGNKLDVDSRYPKILKTGLKLIIKIIEMLLLKHNKVIIRNAIGNHDPHTSFFINEYIKAWFSGTIDEGRISINDEVKTFWFYKFGKNLIGITHGDTCKITDLPEIMASDAAEHWSETEFRYWYIGHVHHTQVKEFRTCIVESFGTLAAKDAWHNSSGYRSQRQIKYKVLHKDYGEIQEGTVNLKMIERELS